MPMADVSQILKGLLEGCVLAVLERGETYGYEVVRILAGGGFPDVGEASVYPLLVRLEQKGQVSFVRKASPLGPARKYYRLTESGQATLAQFRGQWKATRAAVDGFVEKEAVDA